MKESKEIPKKEEEMGITKPYSSVEEWEEDLKKWSEGESVRVYERYGYPELEQRENKIAELIDMKKGEVVLFNAGMAAISTTLENENLTKGSTILYSPDLYSMSKEYVEKNLKDRGVKTVPVDSGNIDELEEAIDRHKPHAIFVETVGNALNAPVVDVDRLIEKTEKTNEEYQDEHTFPKRLEKILGRKGWGHLTDKFEKAGRKMDKEHSLMPLRNLVREMDNVTDRGNALLRAKSAIDTAWLAKREKPMTLVLDNTIPTSTNLKLAPKLEKTDAPVVIVESGTKFFAEDEATLGLAYSKDQDKLLELRLMRARIGTYLPSKIEKLIPEWSKEEFEVRNKQILRNTKYMAETVAKLKGKMGINAVSHPNLPTHKNYKQASETMPDGASAAFYLGCDDCFETAKELKKALGDNVEIGGSFAFEKTRLLPYPDRKVLRIAGGNENPEKMEEILETIEGLNKKK